MPDRVVGFKYVLDASQLEAENAKAAASISNTEAAAKQGANAQAAAMTSAAQVVRNYEREIAAARVELNQLAQRHAEVAQAQGRNSVAAQELTAQMRQQSLAIQGLIAEKRVLNIEAQEEAAAARAAATAERDLASAQGISANSASLSAAQMVRVGGAVDRLAGVGVAGARSMGMLAGALTAGVGPQLLLVIGISLLIGEFLKLIGTTQKKIEIDEKSISADIAATNAARTRADAEAAGAKVKQDLNALLVQYSNHAGEAISKIAEETKATKEYAGSKQTLSQLYKNLQSDSDIARAHAQSEIDRIEKLRQSTASLTGERQKADAEVRKDIKSVIDYGIETGKTRDEILAAAEAANVHGSALERLRAEMDAMTDAERRFQKAREEQKAPNFNTEATRAGLVQLVNDVGGNLEAVLKSPGETMRTAALAQQSGLNQIKKILEETTLSQKGYNAAVSELPKLLRDALAELDKVSVGMKVFGDHSKEVMQQENVAFALRKELYAAEEQIGKQNFEKQRAIMREEFEDRRQMLAKRKQLTQETSLLLTALELDALTKINNAEIKHYEDERKRRQEQLDRGRKEREQELKEFRLHLTAQRNARIEEEERFYKEQREIRLREQRDSRRDQEREFNELNRFFQGRGVIGRLDVDSRQVQQTQQRMEALNLTTQDIARAFGFASNNIRIFNLQLAAIEKFQQGKTFQGMQLAVRALGSELFSVANLAQFVGNAIGSAFEAAISSTDSFGKSLTKAILNFIATIAQQFGSLFITIGSGLMILGWPGGGALIGYGIALLAFAGVLRGLAARLDNNSNSSSAGNSQGAASSAGGGASGGSSGGGTRTTEIAFPTSGSGSRPVTFVLDAKTSRSFMKELFDGEGVVTVSSAQGKHNAQLTKAITRN